MSTASSSQKGSSEAISDNAIDLACRQLVHQSLTFDSPKNGRLRVTFSTTSNFEDPDAEELPCILWVGGMGDSRWHVLDLDYWACKNGVRVIFIDRPGFGGSTKASLENRVDVWIQTIPHILQRLAVPYVALISHSAGIMYLLNTLSRLRHILHPTSPYVAVLAPWVHHEHSNVSLLSLASKLPEGLIGTWSSIIKFVATNIMPLTAYSGGLFEEVSGALFKSKGSADEEALMVQRYGADSATRAERDQIWTRFSFAEDKSGVKDEALLCLKKNGPGMWGVCEDYPTFIKAFTLAERTLLSTNDNETPDTTHKIKRQKLRVRAFFAESDMIIGQGGRVYFDQCWQSIGVDKVVNYKSRVLPGSNHDSVAFARHDALVQVFDEVKEGW